MLKTILTLALLTPIAAVTIENPIVLKIGQIKRIELPANPTSGYLWEITNNPNQENPVEILNEGFDLHNDLVGASGNQFWTFAAKKAGNCQINFEYKQPWTSTATKTQTFTFEVQ